MSWDDKVHEWLNHPVTKAYFADMQNDVNKLTLMLVELRDEVEIYRVQGMVRALQGALDAPENDGIPEKIEEC